MIYLYTLRDSAQQVEGITGVLAICFLIWILIKQEDSFCILKKKKRHEIPRASQMALVVKNPPANARDTGDGSILVPGISCAGRHHNPLQ